MKWTFLRRGLMLTMVLLMISAFDRPAEAQDTPFIGDVRMFGFNFCPRGWTPADGQLMAISQNQALFSLYGTMYGGDGRTTFGLPDLRGRVPYHTGQGAGLSHYSQGQKGGAEMVTLTVQELPSHMHSASATATENFQELTQRNGSDPGVAMRNGSNPVDETPPDVTVSLAATGGNQAHENRPPYQAIRYCVALTGIFPSRN